MFLIQAKQRPNYYIKPIDDVILKKKKNRIKITMSTNNYYEN